ncbi:GH32 C-terminal domain-containing protein [Saccharomonospora saliphila]|uniref:GH32 C-terminal domain-containing protein n=1 Tax=Saccharomonospora saliphila TaxID=369829 RepID=UPI000381F8E8|nr:glycoside hydrolase family 32 protein [Saccharomonospora saliphila]
MVTTHAPRAGLVLASATVLVGATLVAPAPARAGDTVTYPEFPYEATDYTEPHRGQFHFSPRGGWMNDINAPLYYRGEYHLFFQHNPHGLDWDTMHWGHATSPDLVHWTQKPIALEPGVHPGNLWSGSGVVDTANTSGLRDGVDDPIVVFTGTDGVRVAYSTDGGETFQSHDDGRPVVVPEGTSRDAKVFWYEPDERWVMVIWSDHGGNGVDIYTAPDLLNWTFRSRVDAPWLYECPDLVALPVDGDPQRRRWVLADAEGEYVVGDFDGTTFTTDWTAPQKMDQGRTSFDGGTFYAGLTVSHMPDDRVVQLAWQPSNQGSVWTGNATFPAELGLRGTPEGVRVTREPIDEIATLRTRTESWSDRTITPEAASDPLAGVSADTYEISAEFDVVTATADEFGLRLHTRSDGTYDRAVTYDVGARTLYGAPLPPENGRVRMRLLVDRGQLAIFGNDGALSYSDNVDFDSAQGSRGVSVFATGGEVELVSLKLHHLASAWRESEAEATLRGNLGPWHAVGGTWTDIAAGKRGTASGDAFYLGERVESDFTYDADLRVLDGAAAGVTFRASADATEHYTASLDTAGLVKLWRPGADLATAPVPVEAGRTYHVRVVAEGPRIRVYLDGSAEPLIDVTDSAYSSGHLGVNVFDGTAAVNNAAVGAGGVCTNLAGPWNPVAGDWTEPSRRRRGTAAGDGFSLAAATADDVTYSGDVRIAAGGAAGLTLRATDDGSGHYTATLDTAGLVKLWRPGADLASAPYPVRAGRTHHLRVVAEGQRLRVFVDGAAEPLIDVADSAYSSGHLGVNVFDGTADFGALKVGGDSFCGTLGTEFDTLGGSWTSTAGGRRGTASGDAFQLSRTTADDALYTGEIRLVEGGAAGLTFRATDDGSGHYTATLDAAGLVKLWRPGADLATAPVPVETGRTYRLRVEARGERLRVFLNDAADPVLDVTDATYTAGRFGMNVFDGTAEFQDLTAFGA